MSEFGKQLKSLINRFSMENDSNTSDIVLARYLCDCLRAFNIAVIARENQCKVSSTKDKRIKELELLLTTPERVLPTISISEFKNLVSMNSPERIDMELVYGRFAISERVQEKMLEDLQVGDMVFFMDAQPDISHPDVKTNCTLTEAIVVE